MKAPNFKQLAVAAGITMAMGLSGAASAAAITSISLSDFGFGMGQPANSTDSAAREINMDIVMGTFQGDPGFGAGTTASKTTGIVGFNFGFFGPVAGYTSPDTLNDPQNPQLGVNPAPSGDITGGVMSLNLDAWTAAWNGNQFNQGGSTAGTMVISGLTDNGNDTYNFTATWTKLIEGGPFDGNIGNWFIEGTATVEAAVIPVPAAVWLMASGLLGLVGVARRRKAA